MRPMSIPALALPTTDPARCTGCVLCTLRRPFEVIRVSRVERRAQSMNAG